MAHTDPAVTGIGERKMHKVDFSNGEFALYKIDDVLPGTVSGWYDATGALLECEHYPPGFPLVRERVIPVRMVHVRKALARLGRVWK